MAGRTDDTGLNLKGHLDSALGVGQTVRVYDGANYLGDATIAVGQTDWSFADPRTLINDQVLAEAKKKGETGSSMSTLGLGHIPPVLGELGGVACRSIMRRRLLSFSALRQLRFGGTTEQDVACRALLAAYALLGMALSDRELHLRANCHLVESDEPTVTLDLRYGKSRALAPITDEVAVQVFEAALAHAKSVAGVEWNGQTIQLVGDPAILGAASTDDVEV